MEIVAYNTPTSIFSLCVCLARMQTVFFTPLHFLRIMVVVVVVWHMVVVVRHDMVVGHGRTLRMLRALVTQIRRRIMVHMRHRRFDDRRGVRPRKRAGYRLVDRHRWARRRAQFRLRSPCIFVLVAHGRDGRTAVGRGGI